MLFEYMYVVEVSVEVEYDEVGRGGLLSNACFESNIYTDSADRHKIHTHTLNSGLTLKLNRI